jgi:hypothetical protein
VAEAGALRLAAFTATALAVVVVLGVSWWARPAADPLTPAAPPPPTAAAVPWHFALAEGKKLTVYVARLPACTMLTSVVTNIIGTGHVVVSLTGTMTRTPRCERQPTPAFEFDLTEVAMVAVDGATGVAKPIYRAEHLPTVKAGAQSSGRGWGAVSHNDQEAIFEAYLRIGEVYLTVQGKGPALRELSGERFAVGRVEGVIVEQGGEPAFVWQLEQVEYELTRTDGTSISREMLVAGLGQITWG